MAEIFKNPDIGQSYTHTHTHTHTHTPVPPTPPPVTSYPISRYLLPYYLLPYLSIPPTLSILQFYPFKPSLSIPHTLPLDTSYPSSRCHHNSVINMFTPESKIWSIHVNCLGLALKKTKNKKTFPPNAKYIDHISCTSSFVSALQLSVDRGCAPILHW